MCFRRWNVNSQKNSYSHYFSELVIASARLFHTMYSNVLDVILYFYGLFSSFFLYFPRSRGFSYIKTQIYSIPGQVISFFTHQRIRKKLIYLWLERRDAVHRFIGIVHFKGMIVTYMFANNFWRIYMIFLSWNYVHEFISNYK